MGNKWLETAEVINPPDSPYLHIERKTDGGYDYVPSVGKNLTLQTSHITDYNLQILRDRAEHDCIGKPITIPLLPDITDVPPPPFLIEECVRNALAELFDRPAKFLDRLNDPSINLIRVMHGRMWGLLPHKLLSEELTRRGFPATPVVYSFGRGKRECDHGIVLER